MLDGAPTSRQLTGHSAPARLEPLAAQLRVRENGAAVDCRGARDRGARARDNHARDRRQTGLVAAARRERCAVLARGVDVDHRDAAPRRCWTAIRRAIAEACSDSNTSK